MQHQHIFISHSHADNDFGMRLTHDLRRALGDEAAVWYDASGGLHGGDAWWNQILHELSQRPIFMVILSPDSMQSPWVSDEITLAWRQRNSPQGKRIIPVLYRECQIRHDVELLQYVSFVAPRPYADALHELLATLDMEPSSGGVHVPPPQPRPQPISFGSADTQSRSQFTADRIVGSAKGQRYQQFWQRLSRELRARGLAYTPSTIDQANYCEFYAGFEGVLYVASFTGKNQARVALEIGRHDDKRLFDSLQRNSQQIEVAFGKSLTWERMDQNISSRVAAYYPTTASILDTPDKLSDIGRWMSDNMLNLQRTLTPWLERLAKQP